MTDLDPAAEAWRCVRAVRDRFVGRKSEPTDADWAEAIEATLAAKNPAPIKSSQYDEGYGDGYEDAIDEMENAARNARSRRRPERRHGSQAGVRA